MMEEKSIWQIIADALLEEGFDVYPPATKNGDCTEKYIVVKNAGDARVPGYSSEYNYYNVMLYVPQNRYDELELFKKQVKKIMSEKIFPLLVPTGEVTPDFYDDTYKAHMVSIQYRNNVRNKNL